MKKSRPKLVLHKETLRALATINLAQVVGGLETDAADALGQTKDRQCPAAAASAPGG
jgi:hypothetical protein